MTQIAKTESRAYCVYRTKKVLFNTIRGYFAWLRVQAPAANFQIITSPTHMNDVTASEFTMIGQNKRAVTMEEYLHFLKIFLKINLYG